MGCDPTARRGQTSSRSPVDGHVDVSLRTPGFRCHDTGRRPCVRSARGYAGQCAWRALALTMRCAHVVGGDAPTPEEQQVEGEEGIRGSSEMISESSEEERPSALRELEPDGTACAPNMRGDDRRGAGMSRLGGEAGMPPGGCGLKGRKKELDVPLWSPWRLTKISLSELFLAFFLG